MSGVEKINIANTTSSEHSWTPVYAEETDGLLTRIFKEDEEAKKKVRKETYHIMQLCGNPKNDTNANTGLVFGYVQSGKTLSFTTLTALAKDNDYQVVIIIAGTTTNLVDQSYNRLAKDLNINQGFEKKWVMLKNPTDPIRNPQDKNTMSRILESWKKPSTPKEFKKTLLVTVMKNASHLQNLLKILNRLNLEKVPTLIIDDEGDQASMNTRAGANAKRQKKGEILTELEMSTIYRRIKDLKDAIPHHTFLQYTATPQAPLFINILDILSPNFIQLLTPGDKYTGGRAFFIENHYIVKKIPDSEIYSESNHFEEAPETLMEAMRTFFLSVAAGYILGDFPGNPKNRSMMVHPSRLVEEHGVYFEWVTVIKELWAKLLLDRDNEDESKKALIDEFRESYKDLNRNVIDLPSFEVLLNDLGHHISNTAVEQLNSLAGSLVDWNSNYSFILVGGQAMDRGFTVEGLTITYMPRNKGVGNADTIQQRARFFGYKKDFLGHCRVYLDEENIHMFSEYVNHEEDVRRKLADHKLSGQHLNDLKRRFVLDELFKLTRKSVLSEEVVRNTFGNKWVRMNAPHDNEMIIQNNREVVKQFKVKYKDEFNEDEGNEQRTEEQKHLVTQLPLKDMYSFLLKNLKYTRQTDSTVFTNLKSIVDMYTDELPPEDCYVYIMSKGKTRERRMNNKKNVQQLFQGKNPKTGSIIYPGDDKIKIKDKITVQLHFLDIKDSTTNKVVHKNVISIAVWIPARLSQSLITKLDA